MRLSFHPHRLAAAAVIAGGALSLLGGASSASAAFPGQNGLIVTTKCEDGGSTCNVAHLWTVDPLTGTEHPLTSDPASWDDDPAISPDGTRVAYQRCTNSSQTSCAIAVIGIGGGAPGNLASGGYLDYPAFSPDGSKLVFTQNDGAGTAHLYVMDANGANLHPLTSGTVYDRYANWSPDGSSLVFTRFAGPDARIYRIAASGGTAAPLSAGPTDYTPSFSPDGSHIVFSNGTSIQIMDSNGANQHALTAPGQNTSDGGPVFSPDGTQIAFDRYSAGPAPLMVMNADGSNQHLITSASGAYYREDWQSTHPAPPAPSSQPAQVTVPSLKLAAPKKESIRKGRVYLFATSSKAVTGAAKGKVSVPKLAKSYRLRSVSKTLTASMRTRVTLKMPAKTLRAARTALAHHQRVKATVAVRVKDSAGNVTSKRLSIRLTG